MLFSNYLALTCNVLIIIILLSKEQRQQVRSNTWCRFVPCGRSFSTQNGTLQHESMDCMARKQNIMCINSMVKQQINILIV